jgi:hypothetical protein
VLSPGELEFAGHVKQLVTAEAPVEAEYLPAAQLVHPALPLVSLYVPATHGEHGPPSGPEYPALHVHAKDEELIAGELEFRGHTPQLDAAEAPTVLECVPDPQLVHAALPLAILYVPATHAEHVPPFGPEYPALQAHAVTSELELGAFAFTGHTTQVVAVVAPVVLEYVPAPQLAHASVPLAILYVPATHGEHGPPPGPAYPALHTHAASDELMLVDVVSAGQPKHVDAIVAPVDVEYVPAPQLVHAALPLVCLYVPAPHAAHGPPSGPVYPALQGNGTNVHGPPTGPEYPTLQEQAELAPSEKEFAGHAKHVVASVAPVAAEYVPDGHSIHWLTPALPEYCPAGQFVHVRSLVAPPTTENLPAAQLRQFEHGVPETYALPPFVQVVVWYWPAGQNTFPVAHDTFIPLNVDPTTPASKMTCKYPVLAVYVKCGREIGIVPPCSVMYVFGDPGVWQFKAEEHL